MIRVALYGASSIEAKQKSSASDHSLSSPSIVTHRTHLGPCWFYYLAMSMDRFVVQVPLAASSPAGAPVGPSGAHVDDASSQGESDIAMESPVPIDAIVATDVAATATDEETASSSTHVDDAFDQRFHEAYDVDALFWIREPLDLAGIAPTAASCASPAAVDPPSLAASALDVSPETEFGVGSIEFPTDGCGSTATDPRPSRFSIARSNWDVDSSDGEMEGEGNVSKGECGHAGRGRCASVGAFDGGGRGHVGTVLCTCRLGRV